MKVFCIDNSSKETVMIKSNPCHVLLKPASKRVKIIDGDLITEYNFVMFQYDQVIDDVLDLLELHMKIYVDAKTKQEYHAGDH